MSAASSAGTDESHSRSMSNYELALPVTTRREFFRRLVIAPVALARAAQAAGVGATMKSQAESAEPNPMSYHKLYSRGNPNLHRRLLVACICAFESSNADYAS